MALSIPEVISKLLDNVNAGKLVTEVGAGFALTVPLLMMFGMWTEVSVLPADKANDLQAKIKNCKGAITAEKNELADIMENWAKFMDAQTAAAAPKPAASGAVVPPPTAKIAKIPGILASPPPTLATGESAIVQPMSPDKRFIYSRRATARLAAAIEALNAQIKVEKDAAAIAKLAALREPLASMSDQIAAQSEIINTEIQRLASLENELSDSQSLEKNLEVFTNNISAVLAFSVVFGVVVSQVARFVLIRQLYGRLLTRKKKAIIKQADAISVQPTEEKKEEVSRLVPDYYRYAEGCVNLSIPVLLSGFVFPRFADHRLGSEHPYYFLFIAFGLALSTLLLVAGYFTYKDYRKELVKLAPTAPIANPEIND